MGAVKEQSADLYAVKMAERGFLCLSIWRFGAVVTASHAMLLRLSFMLKP